jgi:hypothetical protein
VQDKAAGKGRYLTYKVVLLQLIVPTLCVGMPPWTLCVRC